MSPRKRGVGLKWNCFCRPFDNFGTNRQNPGSWLAYRGFAFTRRFLANPPPESIGQRTICRPYQIELCWCCDFCTHIAVSFGRLRRICSLIGIEIIRRLNVIAVSLSFLSSFTLFGGSWATYYPHCLHLQKSALRIGYIRRGKYRQALSRPRLVQLPENSGELLGGVVEELLWLQRDFFSHGQTLIKLS